MVKKTNTKSKLKVSSKKIPKISRTQKIKKFLKGKRGYIPHILTGTAIAFLLHAVHSKNKLDRAWEKYHLLYSDSLYEKVGIKKDISLGNIKKVLQKCYLEMHPDRSKNESTRGKLELCYKLRDYLRSEGIKV
jgi:preprotein translocase subunit Sec63